MAGVADPRIIRDLTEGPFNAPDMIDDEEEDFQMIDLDTGLVIEDEEEGSTNLFEEIEEGELADALDKAFDQLSFGSNEELSQELEGELFDSGISKEEGSLEELKTKITEEASDLDLDLSFLQSNENENNSQDLLEE